MANLTATQISAAITKANKSIMGEAEMRSYKHSLVGKLASNKNDVFSNLEQLKQSDEQPTKAILFKREYIASGTDKAHDHSGAFADTFEKDIAYIKRSQVFKVSYKQAANNRFGYDAILQHNLRNALMNLYEDISAYAVAWLDTNKSQIGTDSIIAFDEVTNHQFDNPVGSKDKFFEFAKAAMRKNKYRPMYDAVGDQMNAAEYRRIAAQGSANSENLSYQIPGFDYVEEEQIANTADGIMYAFQKGMVGLSTWNEQLNRDGHGAPGDNQGYFTTLVDPVFGMLMDVHVHRDIKNTAAAGGHLQDSVDEYEITPIFTIQGAFESTANATPIFKFAQGA